MFHKAIKLEYGKSTQLIVTFQDGKVIEYDMAVLFEKYPQLKALENRTLFKSGKLIGGYGIIWNDDIDIETETIYEEGKLIKTVSPIENLFVGKEVLNARARKGFSQKELSVATGIDQSDISKIERGIANPSVNTLKRIAQALDANLTISIT